MDAEAAVLAHLDRIDALDRRETPSGELLCELRALLRAAEALASVREREEVVERRRPAPHGT